MTAATGSVTRLGDRLGELAERFVHWLETGDRPEDLFTDDVFVDLSLPHWRTQGQGVDTIVGIREGDHPHRGRVRIEALDRTSRGFLMQVEERWAAQAQQWYCRELIHCIVRGGRISELAVYCTGDWDEAAQTSHAEEVILLRP